MIASVLREGGEAVMRERREIMRETIVTKLERERRESERRAEREKLIGQVCDDGRREEAQFRGFELKNGFGFIGLRK